MAERDGHVRTVMDSLALESRFSQLDNFRSFELSLEEVGWTTLSGRGVGPVGAAWGGGDGPFSCSITLTPTVMGISLDTSGRGCSSSTGPR